MGLSKRWPKKREFLAYYMLLLYTNSINSREINAGEAIDILSVFTGSRRLARNLLKTLVRQGFLERIKPLTYRVKPVEELLVPALGRYIAGRLGRRGIDAAYEEETGAIIISRCIGDSYERINEFINVLKRIGYQVKCE